MPALCGYGPAASSYPNPTQPLHAFAQHPSAYAAPSPWPYAAGHTVPPWDNRAAMGPGHHAARFAPPPPMMPFGPAAAPMHARGAAPDFASLYPPGHSAGGTAGASHLPPGASAMLS